MVKAKLGHGVAIEKSMVFATSLASRSLLKIGLYDGKVIDKIGKKGWNPIKPEFLWPTAIAVIGAGRLAVADAHIGRILVIRSDTLEVETWFGANGPGWKFMNMPYAVIHDMDQILILSTFQGRMLVMDSRTFQVTEHIVFGPPRWNYATGNTQFIAFGARNADDYDVYRYRRGPQIELAGVDFHLSYRDMPPVIRNIAPSISIAGGVLNPANDFYFIQSSVIGQNSVILTSPQIGGGVIYTSLDGITYAIPACGSNGIGSDTWAVDNQLYSPFGPVNMDRIKEINHASIKNLELARHGDSILSREAIFRALPSDCYRQPVFDERFTASFVSQPGKEFFEVYKLWETGKMDAKAVKAAASVYFTKARLMELVSMTEFALVQMLTRMPASLARR